MIALQLLKCSCISSLSSDNPDISISTFFLSLSPSLPSSLPVPILQMRVGCCVWIFPLFQQQNFPSLLGT